MSNIEFLKNEWKATKYEIARLQKKLLFIEKNLVDFHKDMLRSEGVNRFDNLRITTKKTRTLDQARVRQMYNELDQDTCALLPFVAKYNLDKRAYDRIVEISPDTKELVDSCITIKDAKPIIDIRI